MSAAASTRTAVCILAGLGMVCWLAAKWIDADRAERADRSDRELISLVDYPRPVLRSGDRNTTEPRALATGGERSRPASEIELAAWNPIAPAAELPAPEPAPPAPAHPLPVVRGLFQTQAAAPAPAPAPNPIDPRAPIKLPGDPVAPGDNPAAVPGIPEAQIPTAGIVVATGADEPYIVTVPPQIGALKSYYAAHRWLKITPFLEGKALAITCTRVGKTELTLVGELATIRIPVEAVPSVSDIDTVLTRQFPNSSLRITQVAANILMVEGAVDSAAEIQPVMDLLKSLVPTGNVINAMTVAGPMQVQLEVVICRVDRTKLRQLGFNFLGGGDPWFAGSAVGNLISPVEIRGGTPIPQVGGRPLASPFTATNQTSIFLGLTDQNKQIGAYIQALERHSAAKVLARPVLVTMSGRPAEFLNGGKQPYPVVSGIAQNPSVQFEKFGTRLVFLPLVLGQGRIRMEIAPSVSNIDEQFTTAFSGNLNLPRINEQSVHSTVEMESGQTLVIGGMFQNEMVSIVDKVPFLGDLPWAGALFRSTQNVLREQELMVLVTPKLIHPLEPHQVPCRLPGDETRPPDNCELYLHGLPEVPTDMMDDGTMSGIHTGNPAPVEEIFPRWEPKALPLPREPSDLPPEQGSRRTAPAARAWPASYSGMPRSK